MGVWGRMEVTVVVLFEVNWCDIFRFVEDRGVYENLTRASFCNDTPCKEILGLHTKVTERLFPCRVPMFLGPRSNTGTKKYNGTRHETEFP